MPQQGRVGAVFTQALITTQQFDLLVLSLADQQPIKGIFVAPGQVLNRQAMLGSDGQLFKSFPLELLAQFSRIELKVGTVD